jgi:hypothetical protein
MGVPHVVPLECFPKGHLPGVPRGWSTMVSPGGIPRWYPPRDFSEAVPQGALFYTSCNSVGKPLLSRSWVPTYGPRIFRTDLFRSP